MRRYMGWRKLSGNRTLKQGDVICDYRVSPGLVLRSQWAAEDEARFISGVAFGFCIMGLAGKRVDKILSSPRYWLFKDVAAYRRTIPLSQEKLHNLGDVNWDFIVTDDEDEGDEEADEVSEHIDKCLYAKQKRLFIPMNMLHSKPHPFFTR